MNLFPSKKNFHSESLYIAPNFSNKKHRLIWKSTSTKLCTVVSRFHGVIVDIKAPRKAFRPVFFYALSTPFFYRRRCKHRLVEVIIRVAKVTADACFVISLYNRRLGIRVYFIDLFFHFISFSFFWFGVGSDDDGFSRHFMLFSIWIFISLYSLYLSSLFFCWVVSIFISWFISILTQALLVPEPTYTGIVKLSLQD